MPILEYQTTTLLRDTGSITHTSRPFLVSATRGELGIGTLFWEISDRIRPDGSPYINVRPLPLPALLIVTACSWVPMWRVRPAKLACAHPPAHQVCLYEGAGHGKWTSCHAVIASV